MSFSYKENSDCECNFGLCLVCRIIVGGIRGGILNLGVFVLLFFKGGWGQKKKVPLFVCFI